MHAALPRISKPIVVAAALALGALALVAILTRFPAPGDAKASSHSEAPLISQDPRADNTDLYAFVSPDDTSTVTIIANYIPLEAPASGPNFYSFDDSALYQIGIDQTGDGKADLAYQFRFNTQTFRATGYSLSAATCSFARRLRTFTNQIRNRVFLVELAGLAARCLLPFVQLFLVISHSYPRDAIPRFPSLCTSPAAIEFDRGGTIATTRSRPFRLASYKATSAAFSTSAAVCASRGHSATPKLAVM